MQKWLTKLLNPDISLVSFDRGMLVFRVLVSLSMINTHGIKKLLHFEATVANIPDPFGLGGELSTYIALLANIVCPLLVMAGLFTRFAALQILSVTIMGFLVVHINDPWTVKDVPLMYSLAYLLILYLGPGKHSLDAKLFNPTNSHQKQRTDTRLSV